MKKRIFHTEWAYVLGLLLLALGTALTEYGNLGMSMVVAPAYLLHLKLVQLLPFFSFGMAEYVLQAVLLAAMMLVLRRVKLSYLLSFATAVLYGFMLDGAMALLAALPQGSLPLRILFYAAGITISGAGIALLFHSYLPPEAYELFVKELSRKLGVELHLFKTIYDCASLVLAVALSFAFFGRLQGVGVGTVLCALVNGAMIRLFSRLYERSWQFCDGLKLRGFFEREGE